MSHYRISEDKAPWVSPTVTEIGSVAELTRQFTYKFSGASDGITADGEPVGFPPDPS